jgi:N-acetylgalactosamine kinase
MDDTPEQLLAAMFDARCGDLGPVRVARAPGRINLIGEHTDYNGLGVLPFAIPLAVRIAFAPRDDDLIVAENVLPTFAPARFRASPEIPPDPPGSWINYVKAAVQALSRRIAAERSGSALRGFQALVDGDIPLAGGLSSSSALVVAAALAFLDTNNEPWRPLDLATELAEAEHYVGTRGGGMDQAASLCGAPETALHMDFFPLDVTPVPFPASHGVLACHSLVAAAKTEGARAAYNLRVAECALGCRLLRRQFDAPDALRLGDIARRCGGEEAIAALRSALGEREPVPAGRVAAAIGLAEDAFLREFLPAGLPAEAAGGLRVLSRCTHVLREGARVVQAADALRRGDMAEVGRLMDEAHASARDLYGISCPELEVLTAIGRRGGALGSRLTGAGFGGFAVLLAETDRLPALIAAVDEGFYRRKRPGAGDYDDLRFVVRPAAGASVEQVPDA